MRRNDILPRAILLLVIYLLLVTCSTSQPTHTPTLPTATFTSVPPTATNTSVPPATATNTFAPPQPLCDGEEGTCLEIRFDEDNCMHVGPEIVPAGEITIFLSNYGSSNIGIDLEILDEGMTWDNMSAYINPSPSSVSQPSWSQNVATGGAAPGEHVTRHLELSAGTYISVCWRMNPHLVWLGGELIVE